MRLTNLIQAWLVLLCSIAVLHAQVARENALPPAGQCVTAADCGDLDGDGARDDACLFYECIAGLCAESQRTSQAAFGSLVGDFIACPPDTCDPPDPNLARFCFANVDALGTPPFPCEDNAPFALNIDAVGFGGRCELDGFCDINDIYAPLNCFANTGTDGLPPFACECTGPGPQPDTEQRPVRLAAAGIPPRCWMVELGTDPSAAPISGPTQVVMAAGSTKTIAVYFEDTVGVGLIDGVQTVHGWAAGGGAGGTVGYVDLNSGAAGGDSVLVDVANADWLFANAPFPASVIYNETPALFLGTIQENLILAGVDAGPGGDVPNPGAPNYIVQFDVQASADASGTFTLPLNEPGQCSGGVCVSGTNAGAVCTTDAACSDSPGSGFFAQFGAPFAVEFQPLEIVVLEAQFCESSFDCGDLVDNDSGMPPPDGIRDDPCKWYDCVGNACVGVDRTTQADMGTGGSEPNPCALDGACGAEDRFHALNCFSNKDFMGNPSSYPCEQNPPAAVNVDAGKSESCDLDGVCDGNDAIHAVTLCFQNKSWTGAPGYPCNCSTPAPWHTTTIPEDQRRATGITLRAPRSARPGELIDVEAYAEDELDAMLGFQLHVDAVGGKTAGLELVDIFMDEDRPDWLFADVPGVWKAFNRDIGQMGVGMDAGEGVATAAGGYLATFTFRVPENASGCFAVDLNYSHRGADPAQRTFLFGPWGRLIDVPAITPARIEIEEPRVRMGRRSD